MDKKKKIIISVLSVLLIIFFAAAATYSYFKFFTNSGTAETTAGKLDIDYNISNATLEGLLVPANSKSSSVMETVTAKLNTGSVPGNLNIYITPTFLTGMPDEAVMWEVEVFDTSNNLLSHFGGDFDNAVINTPVKVVNAYPLTTSLLTFKIYIWLNGARIDNDNFSSDNGFSATITADSEQITGIFDLEPTPINDFEYEIGTGDRAGYVILTKYIGTNTDVVVPSTYTIDNTTYNVGLYTKYFGYKTEGVFKGNTLITSVNLPSSVTIFYVDPNNTWYPNQANHLFNGCTNLESVSALPSSITQMMYTFQSCTSLVNAPEIPSSVQTLFYTFVGCTNLTAAPEIPASVTNMVMTFSSCTSLAGTVRINAPNIPSGNFSSTFYNITNSLTVEVPSGSTTYTSLTNSNPPANVTITTFTPSS